MLTSLKKNYSEHSNVFEALEEIKENHRSDKVDIACLCDWDETAYISDAFTEMADSHVDIYTADLFEWFADGDNFALVDDAIEQFGKGRSILDDIRMAQYMANEVELYEKLTDAVKIYALDYLKENGLIISDDSLEMLLDECEKIDANDRLSDVVNLCNEWAATGE